MRQEAIGIRYSRDRVAIDTWQVREETWINWFGEIDEAQVVILVTRFIDDRDRIASTDVHRSGITIVLIRHIEGTSITAY
jgi:hypothetical protein